MNDADQIRRCNGALCANLSLLQIQNPEFSNREALRLEINVTQTKQTTQPHSNREAEALFSSRVRAVNRPPRPVREPRRLVRARLFTLREAEGQSCRNRRSFLPALA